MKRIFACLFFTAVLPFFASPTKNSSTYCVPFATVAYAGHSVLGGGWCDCGPSECICDPDEQPNSQSARTISDPNDEFSQQGATSGSAGRTVGFDLGSSALTLALAFFLWTRLRG